jgi:hypothetical protein
VSKASLIINWCAVVAIHTIILFMVWNAKTIADVAVTSVMIAGAYFYSIDLLKKKPQ